MKDYLVSGLVEEYRVKINLFALSPNSALRNRKTLPQFDLKKCDQKLASKYIKLREPIVRFKINDFRPYPFF